VPLARAAGARIVLLQVVPSVMQYLAGPSPVPAPILLDPAWDEEALVSAQGYVESMAKRLQHADVPAEGHALIGRIGPTIVNTANAAGADLIVMSTHALTGPARAVLGSTADEVVRAAHRSVLLLRRSS
jgi:nucleotide-binding universal stress UspA family protein